VCNNHTVPEDKHPSKNIEKGIKSTPALLKGDTLLNVNDSINPVQKGVQTIQLNKTPKKLGLTLSQKDLKPSKMDP
jgi:hypothetical protein